MSKYVNSVNDFNKLVGELYNICVNDFQSEIKNTIDTLKIKQALNMTFMSWNIFIKTLKAEGWKFIPVLEKNEYSFKTFFFNNKDLKRIYSLL